MKKILLLLTTLIVVSAYTQDIRVKNNVFETLYSQSLEQPLWIRYRSTNRPTNVNRGTMDFYKELGIKTSDAEDYIKNVYDKGHGAPAATFSDNIENLKQTFSYLNSIMQNQYLNRGEWRMLEEQIRKWDDTENITVLITLHFDSPIIRVPTGAAIPAYIEKHIYFEGQKKWRCFVFLNERPKFKWDQLEKLCEPNEHNK